jgi:hypothetical protein
MTSGNHADQTGTDLHGPGLFFVQTADSTVDDTTTSEQSMFGTGTGTLTLPANALAVGRQIQIRLAGFDVDGGHDYQLLVKLGGTTLLDSTSFNWGGDSIMWELNATITCRTVGVTGTVVATGTLHLFANSSIGMATTVPVTIDTTGTLALDVTFTPALVRSDTTYTTTEATVILAG